MIWRGGVYLSLSTVRTRWFGAVRKCLWLFHHSLCSCHFGHSVLPGSASDGESMGGVEEASGFQSKGVLKLNHGKLGYWHGP